MGLSRRVWVTIGEGRDGESVLNEVKRAEGEREGGSTRGELEKGGRK